MNALVDCPVRSLDPRSLAIERCADQIERVIGKLSLVQRIGLERALDALVDEARTQRHKPWD